METPSIDHGAAPMALERLFITCGGTGGHFYPGLAIAHKFRQQGGKVILLLSGVNAKTQAEIARSQGIEAEILPCMPHPAKKPFKFIHGLTGGFFKTIQLTKKHSPQALLGMGSFASLPAVAGIKFKRIPLFLHDGNARIGRANRWFSRWAKLIASAFPCVNANAIKAPLTITGMPARQKLVDSRRMDKKTAISELNCLFGTNLDENRKTILVFGGSQGAEVFNKNFPQAFMELGNHDFQILHLCGKGKIETPQAIYNNAKFPYLLLESSEKMELFLAAADLAACRSGGSSLAELALFGLPAILIPYPAAAEGHQTDNANVFAKENAAILINNKDLDIQKAKDIIHDFLANPEKWQAMSQNMASLARPEASEELLSLIDKAVS